MTSTLIKNGRIIDPGNKIDEIWDILIKDWKIERIWKIIDNWKLEIIDATWKIICPWFVDIHVHLREPWREDKETIKTASLSAAKWWITSVVAMPNTNPPIDNQTVIEYVLSKAKKDSVINIFVSWCITKWGNWDSLAEIWEMKQAWAVVVTDDWYDIQDLWVYRKAMQYCKTHSMPMLSHSEDSSLSKWGCIHEWKISTKLWLPWIPAVAEDAAVARILCLVEEVDHGLHFTHVSTKSSVEMIENAQKKWLKVTADATPHHFSLTDEAVWDYNTCAKVNPPLRSKIHKDAIVQWLKSWTISVIATDHAPHLWTEKMRDIESAPFWIVWFETMLPLIITNLVDTKVLSLSEAIAKITCNPSKILNLNKWKLSIWSDADITIFDPKAKIVIDKTKFESKWQNSPFHGQTLSGKVTDVLVWGKLVLRNWELIK